MEKSNVPKLRFEGFEDEWKEYKLKKIADVVGGGTPSTNEIEYWNGEIQWFTPSEIGDKKYVDFSNRTITELGLKKSSAKVLPKGTILLTTRASLGDMAILKNKATTNQGFQSLIIKENFNNEFVYYMKDKISKFCYKNSSGSTFLEISKSNLEKFKAIIPSLKEQTKIANFLSNVDNIIEEQEGKVKDLEQYKKGMMQKIFEQEVRFKDENGEEYPEWEEKWFSEILIEDLYPVKKPNKPYEKLSVRSHAKGTFSSLVEKPEEVAMDTLYEVKANQLIVNITFAWEHAIAIVNKEDEGKLVSHRFPTYKFSNNSNYKFYRYVITQKIIKYKLGLASPGGAGRNRVLNKKEFLKIEVPNPCLQEQTKIANFLSNIDNIIEEENKKLEDLKLWKKGLLQQMFV